MIGLRGMACRHIRRVLLTVLSSIHALAKLLIRILRELTLRLLLAIRPGEPAPQPIANGESPAFLILILFVRIRCSVAGKGNPAF